MKVTKILFFTWFIIGVCSQGRAQYYNTYWISPHAPTSNDSIFLYDSIDLPYQLMRLYFDKVQISNNFIEVSQCYKNVYGPATGKSITEKTALGKLPLGTYSGIIYARDQFSQSDTDCTQYGIYDSMRFSFTVSAPLGISGADIEQFTFSPNPARDKIFSDFSMRGTDVIIIDMSGRVITLPVTDREIDVSSLPSGMYCIRLRNKGGTIVRRFVKE